MKQTGYGKQQKQKAEAMSLKALFQNSSEKNIKSDERLMKR